MLFKVFVTNLGKYNEGELVGKWLSLPCDNLTAELESIGVIEGTSYEEYFITDYENDFSYEVGEYESLEKLNELAETLSNLEDYEQDHIAAIIEADGCDLEKAIDLLQDSVFYPSMSLLDVAYELIEDCYNLPEIAQRYFDYDAFARDLGFEGYIETSYGVVYIS